MSSRCLFLLFCALLVSTQSSPIDEIPVKDENTLLSQGNDDISNSSDSTQGDDTNSKLEENSSISDINALNCTQLEACVDCVSQHGCTMFRQDNENGGESEYICLNDTTTYKEIRQAFAGTAPPVEVQDVSNCPKIAPIQPTQGKEKKSSIEMEDSTNVTKTTPDQSTTQASNTTISVNTTTNGTTNSTATTATTITTTPVTTSTSATTENVTTITTTTSKPSTNSTITTMSTTSENASPPPPSGGGWSFWSFFGGILLTLGLFAIGFVGFKYYKARSVHPGGGSNYNRF